MCRLRQPSLLMRRRRAAVFSCPARDLLKFPDGRPSTLCIPARRHGYANRAWNVHVHKTPSLQYQLAPREIRMSVLVEQAFAGRARFPRRLTFCRRRLSAASFSSFTLSYSFRLQQRQAAYAPLFVLHPRAIPFSLSFTPNNFASQDAHRNLALLHSRRQYGGPGDRGRLAGRRLRRVRLALPKPSAAHRCSGVHQR